MSGPRRFLPRLIRRLIRAALFSFVIGFVRDRLLARNWADHGPKPLNRG